MKRVQAIVIFILSLLLMLTALGCSGGAASNDKASGDKASSEKISENNTSNGKDTGSTNAPEPGESKGSNSESGGMPALDKDLQNCIIELDGIANGQKSVTKLYRLNNKGKTDMYVDGKLSQSLYSDFEKQEGYVYTPFDNEAMRSMPQGGAVEYLLAPGPDVNPEEMKKSGSENINGFDCTVYKMEAGDYLITGWVYEKTRLVIKYELKLKDGKIGRSYTVTKFQTGGVTDEMVSLPKGANIKQ